MTPSDDNLDQLLREGLRAPDLPCGGFDRKVLKALARPNPAGPIYLLLLCLGGLSAAAGLGYGLALLPPPLWGDYALDATARAAPASGLAFPVAAAGVLYAVWAARKAFGNGLLRLPARR